LIDLFIYNEVRTIVHIKSNL